MKSIAVFLLIIAVSTGAIFKDRKWATYRVLVWDPAGYYLYLASAFVTHDTGDSSFSSGIRASYRPDLGGEYGLVPAPNGRKVFKYPMGMAVLYAPGFFVADGWVRLKGKEADGFGAPYQKALVLVCWLYATWGLWVLRTVLKDFFSDTTVAFTLLAIGLGTNLWCYSTYESPMTHGSLFWLNACVLWATVRWYRSFELRYGLLLALALGLAVLIRPTEVLMAAIPLLWGLTSGAALRQRLLQWQQHWGQLVVMIAVAGSIVAAQLIFWRVVGGTWFIDSYPGEDFDFLHPQIWNGFFHPRKGWLLYSPMLGLALGGIFWLRRFVPAALPPVLFLVPVVVYITFSWWDWSYGGGFGARPLISEYALLSFPLASLAEWSRAARRRLLPLSAVLTVLVVFSLMQSYQYSIGIINCCDISWEQYRERFFMLEW